jgi:hypothetical protein
MDCLRKGLALVLILIMATPALSLLMVKPAIADASTVHAQTLTKDFGISNVQNLNGSTVFSYDVTVNIQTEPNGDWICDNDYQVSWVITLTYVNQTMNQIMFKDLLTITFYQSIPTEMNDTDFNPRFTMVSAIFRPTLYQSGANGSVPAVRSIVNGSAATLSAAFTAFGKPEDFQFDYELDYSVTSNGLPSYNSGPGDVPLFAGEWLQNTPLYINIVSAQTAPAVPEFSWLVVVSLLLSLFPVAVLFRHRKTTKLRYRGTAQ